ncbi:SpaA isopeptide-forming pilin-related protein [Levilactobacillus wangkuiensis]|uniref:SpaA isopeptide-forming pilin-related protein n=1 Tax=Levilactobacillus wangkuiensis TaxID=2799566 RepID=UPI001941DBC9|nr:SpaA isopeptide-forming pilin-related protein [Levilactobacillus wangkuiensis]
MGKRIGLIGFSLMVTLLILLGFQSSAQASSIDNNVQGLSAPSKVEEETGDNTYTPVTDPTAPLKSGQNYRLSYTWKVADNTAISDGDTATVTLPDSASHGYVKFDVTTGDQTATKVGDFLLPADDGHTATITFNNALANANTYHQGTLTFNVTGTSGTATGGGNDYVVAKNGWIQKSDYNDAGIPKQAVWQIVFNPTAKNMGTVKLTDTLGAYQTYVAGSVSATNETTGDKVTPTVVSDGSKLTMTFTNVTGKISLSYYAKVDTTAFTGQTSGYLSNNVDLSAADGESGSAGTGSGSGSNPDNPTMTADSHKNVQWGGSATIGGDYIGSVTLTKTAADQATVLSGAEYTLQKLNPATGMYEDLQTKMTTDSHGVINDYGLAAGTYQFVETQAPSGYQLNTTPVPFVISATNKDAHQTVTQADSQGTVKLTKFDKSSQDKLAGAIYALAYGSGWQDHEVGAPVSADEYTTGDDGTLTVTGLAPGNYEFIEEQAPTGYLTNTTPMPFTISGTEQRDNVVNVKQDDVFATESSSSPSSSTSVSSNTSSVSSSASSQDSSVTSETESTSSASSSVSGGSSQSSETTVSSATDSSQESDTSITSSTSSSGLSDSSTGSSSSSSVSSNTYTVPSASSSQSQPGSEPSSAKSTSSESTSVSSSSDSMSSGGSADRVTSSSVSSSSSSISRGTTVVTTSSHASSTPTISSSAPATAESQNHILPQTNEGKGVLALMVGLVLLGVGTSAWQWHRTH